jgi:hypothetical protein
MLRFHAREGNEKHEKYLLGITLGLDQFLGHKTSLCEFGWLVML